MSRARHKKASGGRVFYDGGNSNVAKEAADTTDSFKKGGRAVGKAPGKKSKARMDKRARGGRIGGSPFSSAATPTPKSVS